MATSTGIEALSAAIKKFDTSKALNIQPSRSLPLHKVIQKGRPPPSKPKPRRPAPRAPFKNNLVANDSVTQNGPSPPSKPKPRRLVPRAPFQNNLVANNSETSLRNSLDVGRKVTVSDGEDIPRIGIISQVIEDNCYLVNFDTERPTSICRDMVEPLESKDNTTLCRALYNFTATREDQLTIVI